ncbi:peptidoglycan D,D-transpeptidase FtsI family protein [Brevibacillus sp. SYSU BS000544]|uniref:peptidoglycan D,D-transpeptidase FtsI family protein n=1 Tax=Brevibacillus sp. SYSU BS000544 TaxID=3416443 RepID=UPI003CE5453E
MQLIRSIKRRHFIILLLITALFGGLLLRLWWIQVGFTHHFTEHDIDLVKNAVKQRQQTIILNHGRGDITDRNGVLLTGKNQIGLIIFPLARGSIEGTKSVTKLASIINQPEEVISKAIRQGKTPSMLRNEQGEIIRITEQQAKDINELQISGILALSVTERYKQDGGARQLIGYVSQNPELIKQKYETELITGQITLESMIGASGLERSFDRFLQGNEPSSLSYYVDGKGHPLRGLEIRHKANDNAFYPLTLVTTIDQSIQQELERVADEMKMREGSIVVLDAETSDVIAMVSRPDYDPAHVDVNNGAWRNHAYVQLPPGSVFKTVVAAAALGEGVVSPNDTFLCEGEYGKYGFSCWNKKGHGHITMQEAFAQSCNIAFAEIAKKVGGARIDEYAKRMGVAVPVGWTTEHLYKLENFKQLDGEEQGRVFAANSSQDDEGILIQSAIGQRDVRMTPLQAANMMATIARQGQAQQVRLVSEITYRNGITFHHFSRQPLAAAGIDRLTAKKLTTFLANVVGEGTGEALQGLPWEVAGKSGTAQTISAGQNVDHQWFAGFTPVDKPKYAIAVVMENLPAHASHKATQLFKRVVVSLASDKFQSDPLPETYRRE